MPHRIGSFGHTLCRTVLCFERKYFFHNTLRIKVYIHFQFGYDLKKNNFLNPQLHETLSCAFLADISLWGDESHSSTVCALSSISYWMKSEPTVTVCEKAKMQSMILWSKWYCLSAGYTFCDLLISSLAIYIFLPEANNTSVGLWVFSSIRGTWERGQGGSCPLPQCRTGTP